MAIAEKQYTALSEISYAAPELETAFDCTTYLNKWIQLSDSVEKALGINCDANQ